MQPRHPFGSSTIYEMIQVFKGQVTVLQLQEKKAASMRRRRSGRPLRGGRAIVDSTREISTANPEAKTSEIREQPGWRGFLVGRSRYNHVALVLRRFVRAHGRKVWARRLA